ncbi:MAG: hypothetical protein ACYC9S_14155 [Leptospirales bacterium]
MNVADIGKEVWKELQTGIKLDREQHSPSWSLSNPGILILEKRAFYEPYPGDLIHSFRGPNTGGRFFGGNRFTPKSEEEFCERFLYRSQKVNKFKEVYGSLVHPGTTNILMDNLAAAVTVFAFTDRILGSIQKNTEPRWSQEEESIMTDIVDKHISVRAYAGVSNIMPVLDHNAPETGADNSIFDLKTGSSRTVIRQPSVEDFPKYLEAGVLVGNDELPGDISKPVVVQTSLMIYTETYADKIPLRFHSRSDFIFMRIPGFFSSIDAFELSFQWVRTELGRILSVMGLLQSVTCLVLATWGYSVYLGDRMVYEYRRFNDEGTRRNCGRFYEWELKEKTNVGAIEKLISSLMHNGRLDRLYEREGNGSDGDRRLRTAYTAYWNIVEHSGDTLQVLRLTIESLEKFFSQTRNSRVETKKALANLTKYIFEDSKYVSEVFNLGYCLRSKYTHNEIESEHIGECLDRLINSELQQEDRKNDYNWFASAIQRSCLELLRQTIIVCLD